MPCIFWPALRRCPRRLVPLIRIQYGACARKWHGVTCRNDSESAMIRPAINQITGGTLCGIESRVDAIYPHLGTIGRYGWFVPTEYRLHYSGTGRCLFFFLFSFFSFFASFFLLFFLFSFFFPSFSSFSLTEYSFAFWIFPLLGLAVHNAHNVCTA